MSKKRVGIGSISFLLIIIALIWSYNIFGFCLGDQVFSIFKLPAWSNENKDQIVNTFSIVTFSNKGQGTHYTAYYALIFVLPALVFAIKNKNHLFAVIVKMDGNHFYCFIVNQSTVSNDLRIWRKIK